MLKKLNAIKNMSVNVERKKIKLISRASWMTTLGTTPYKSAWNFEIKTLLYELGTISKKKFIIIT